jgi:GNAT superfamily N-acetyltransferase
MYRSPDTGQTQEIVGMPSLPRIRQPNGYTCGPTCLRIVLDHLCFMPRVSVTRLAVIMGAGPVSGTTEVEMARGLAAARLSFQHPGMTGMARRAAGDYLREALRDDQIVFLRTLLHGHKHWVLLHGWEPGSRAFHVMCPAVGPLRWSEPTTLDAWQARGFDHFLAPADPSRHPAAVADVGGASVRNWRPVHATPIRRFLLTDAVVRNDHQGEWHLRMIGDAARSIFEMPDRDDALPIPYAYAPEFRFLSVPRGPVMSDMLALRSDDSAVAGGIHRGVRWVAPEFRGRGLGTELALVAHSIPQMRFLFPCSYSEGGWASRVAAHGLAVERAVASGLAVPAAILADREIPRPRMSGGFPVDLRKQTVSEHVEGQPAQIRLF